ncbi:MAG: PKD domain-containing protein, partial [Thermoplasmata archaeon]|nr:PKD domain-containing protein [Thermoplasmata archaeon]
MGMWVRIVTLAVCFILMSSGLGLVSNTGEEEPGFQNDNKIAENLNEPISKIKPYPEYSNRDPVQKTEICPSERTQGTAVNTPPVANAGPDITMNVGPHAPAYLIPFNGSGSYDPDGTIIDYSWDFGDGNSSGGEYIFHSYTAAGNYTVILTVTDDLGATDTDTISVTLIEMPAWTVTTDKYTYRIGEPVTIFFWGIISLPATGDHWYVIEDEHGNLVV